MLGLQAPAESVSRGGWRCATTPNERHLHKGALPTIGDRVGVGFIQVALAVLMDNNTRGIEPTLYRSYLTIFLDGIRAEPRASRHPGPCPGLSGTDGDQCPCHS